jgi:hypothetical protein
MSNPNNEDEELIRQMFFVGLLGLPWLWTVNCLYFLPKIRNEDVSPEFKKCILVYLWFDCD